MVIWGCRLSAVGCRDYWLSFDLLLDGGNQSAEDASDGPDLFFERGVRLGSNVFEVARDLQLSLDLEQRTPRFEEELNVFFF